MASITCSGRKADHIKPAGNETKGADTELVTRARTRAELTMMKFFQSMLSADPAQVAVFRLWP